MATAPVFYLGTHIDGWLNHVGVPLFVSHRRLARRKALPKARMGWALDSGGFSELSLYGGWRTTPEDYVAAVKRYDRQIGNLEWASPMDWMCEESMLAKTGLTVLEHQRRTVANFVLLEQLWRDSDDQWHPESPFMPVLQGGQTAETYLQCWDMYAAAGVDLSNYPLVGVGSVCRRQHTGEIRDILEAIRDRDPEIPLHGFGVKTLGLKLYGDLLCSADSLGWSFNARKNPRLPGCAHTSCSNCVKWALRWRRGIVAGSGCAEHGEPCDGTIGACHLRDLWAMREQAAAAATTAS